MALLRKSRNSPFCSEEHRLKFMAEQEQIALARLIDAQVAKRPERLDLSASPLAASVAPQQGPPEPDPAPCGFMWPRAEYLDSPSPLAKAGLQAPPPSAAMLPRVTGGVQFSRLTIAPCFDMDVAAKPFDCSPKRLSATPQSFEIEPRLAAFHQPPPVAVLAVAFPLPLASDINVRRVESSPVRIAIPPPVAHSPQLPRKVRAGLKPRRPLVRLDEDPPVAGSINIVRRLLAVGSQACRTIEPNPVEHLRLRYPHLIPVTALLPSAFLVPPVAFRALATPVTPAGIFGRSVPPTWPVRKQNYRFAQPPLSPCLGPLSGLELRPVPGPDGPRPGTAQAAASGPSFRSPHVRFQSGAFALGIAPSVLAADLSGSTARSIPVPIAPIATSQRVPVSLFRTTHNPELLPCFAPPASVASEWASEVARALPLQPSHVPLAVRPAVTGPPVRSRSIPTAAAVPLIWPAFASATPSAFMPLGPASACNPQIPLRRPRPRYQATEWTPEQPHVSKPLSSVAPRAMAFRVSCVSPIPIAIQTTVQIGVRQAQLQTSTAAASQPAGRVPSPSLVFKPMAGALSPVWLSVAIPLVLEPRRKVKGPGVRPYAGENEAPAGFLNNALGRWRSLSAIPKWSGVVLFLALAGFAGIPRQGGNSSSAPSEPSGLDAMLARRAAVELRDEFREGLAHWEGEGDWSRSWKLDAAGFLQPGPVATYRPSRRLEDYEFEFLGQIIHKSMGWAVRAGNLKNYQAVKLSIVGGGAVPEVALIRYPVIHGKPGKATQRRVPMDLRLDTVYRVSTRVTGNDFTVTIQGQVVDYWNEPALAKGGVGLFTAKGEQARIRWIEVRNQTDMIGKLCALLAPAPIEVKR
ncbi:MAG: hypothetical protein IT168_02015 [Bryobacterales bacterium]|nr:hypothetical protein [Bryobacterales bacterium]